MSVKLILMLMYFFAIFATLVWLLTIKLLTTGVSLVMLVHIVILLTWVSIIMAT